MEQKNGVCANSRISFSLKKMGRSGASHSGDEPGDMMCEIKAQKADPTCVPIAEVLGVVIVREIASRMAGALGWGAAAECHFGSARWREFSDEGRVASALH